MNKLNKILMVLVLSLTTLIITACGSNTTKQGSNTMKNIDSSSLEEGTSYISLEDYRNKAKGGLVGTMVGVSYGTPIEFRSKTWIEESTLHEWYEAMILNAYNQDDVYLSTTAIEALYELGLDVTSKELGIYMYNKDFEYWNGSNNDVLARGFCPPFAGYPKYSTTYLTCAYPDSCSYECGASFGGLIGLDMLGFSNDIVHRVAEVCTYGDGIYGTQFIAAMYGKAFFTDDIREIVNAGIASVPSDSWTNLVVLDTIDNYEKGMTAKENFNFLYDKYIMSEEYNWIGWPNNLLLDSKMCVAFTVMGLLYGNKDFMKSIKITICCANDNDSTAAATAGILGVILGYDNIPDEYKNGIIENQKFKYSSSTVDGLIEKCESLVKEIVVRQGGMIGMVDHKESFIIPKEAKSAVIEKYQNSKYPDPMELMTYTPEEMDKMRLISDPGFERCSSGLANGWSTNIKGHVRIERIKQTSNTGICNAKILAKEGEDIKLYTTVDVSANTNYVLTCYIATSDDFSSNVFLMVNNNSGVNLRSQKVDVSGDYAKVTMTVNSGNNTILQIGVMLSSTNNDDLIRVDDFSFQKK